MRLFAQIAERTSAERIKTLVLRVASDVSNTGETLISFVYNYGDVTSLGALVSRLSAPPFCSTRASDFGTLAE